MPASILYCSLCDNWCAIKHVYSICASHNFHTTFPAVNLMDIWQMVPADYLQLDLPVYLGSVGTRNHFHGCILS